jgi:hypothetical protein
VTAHTARLQRLDQALHEHGPAWRLHAVVEALQALRGVPCTVAVTMGAAMGLCFRPARVILDFPRPPVILLQGTR